MADNAELNAGAGGVTLATDDVGADVHYQKIKLADGTADSTTMIEAGGGTEANAIRVTIANDSTGVVSVDDNGASLTVDNTNIDNLHSADFDTGAGADTTTAVGIAVPAAGGAAVVPGDATAGLKVDLGADNDVVVSGTVTANLSATDNAVLDSIDASNAAIQTAVELIDNAIAGSEMQVDVVTSALPSGAATAANQLPDGHNVTVDNAGGASAVNVQDGGNSLTVDGTVTADAGTGPWPVTDNGESLTVDNTNVDNLHSADFDTGAGTDTTPAIGIAVPASGGAAVIPGDATAGLKVDLGADNDVVVSGTVTANLSATDNTVLDNIQTAVELIDNAIAGSEMQVDVVTSALPSGAATAANQLPDGHNVTIDNASGASAVNIQDGGNSITVDGTVTANAGTGSFTVAQATASNLNAQVRGGVAHDAADANPPIKIGAKAVASLEAQTAVAANDRTNLYADTDGVLVTKGLTTFGDIISERVSNTDGASTAFSTFGAPGAGKRNYVTQITVHNASATNGYVDIRDGTAGAVLYTIPLPANGGAVVPFPEVPLRQPTANTALAFDVSAALTTVYISMVGFQSVL